MNGWMFAIGMALLVVVIGGPLLAHYRSVTRRPRLPFQIKPEPIPTVIVKSTSEIELYVYLKDAESGRTVACSKASFRRQELPSPFIAHFARQAVKPVPMTGAIEIHHPDSGMVVLRVANFPHDGRGVLIHDLRAEGLVLEGVAAFVP